MSSTSRNGQTGGTWFRNGRRTVLNNGAHSEVGAILDYTKEPADGLAVGVVGRAAGPSPTCKVDGYPAHQAPGLPYVHGFDVRITASGSTLAKLNKTDGGRSQDRDLRRRPADWTTNPVD